jgi:hypothetical protein
LAIIYLLCYWILWFSFFSCKTYFLMHYFGCDYVSLDVGYRLYNLNYAPTTSGVRSWRENISEGTRKKKVEYLCFRVCSTATVVAACLSPHIPHLIRHSIVTNKRAADGAKRVHSPIQIWVPPPNPIYEAVTVETDRAQHLDAKLM